MNNETNQQSAGESSNNAQPTSIPVTGMDTLVDSRLRQRRSATDQRSASIRPTPSRSEVAGEPRTLDIFLRGILAFVDLGYGLLSPEWEQAPVKPIWGLAKPMPHVVRAAM